MVAIATEFASSRKSRIPKTHTPWGQVQLSGLRYYNPTLGRWISRDPIGERGGVLLYSFVVNAPISERDAWGLTVDDQVVPLNEVSDAFFDVWFKKWTQDADPSGVLGGSKAVVHPFSLRCKPCGGTGDAHAGTGCRKLVMEGDDTSIWGFVMWRTGAGGTKTDSTRDVEGHENQHWQHAKDEAQTVDDFGHSLLSRGCTHWKCCYALADYYNAIKKYHGARTDTLNASLDYEDYREALKLQAWFDFIGALQRQGKALFDATLAAAVVQRDCGAGGDR